MAAFVVLRWSYSRSVGQIPLAPRDLILQLRRVRAAGGRYDAVEPHVHHELAIVIGGMPDGDTGETEARVWSGVRAFDGIEHIFLGDGAERFPQRLERIAQIGDELVARFRRTGSALITIGGRRFAVQLGGECKIGA